MEPRGEMVEADTTAAALIRLCAFVEFWCADGGKLENLHSLHRQSPHLEPLKEDTLAGTYKSVSQSVNSGKEMLHLDIIFSVL